MKIIHVNVTANDNQPNKFSDDVDRPMSELCQSIFDMMNDMNNAFAREFLAGDIQEKNK